MTLLIHRVEILKPQSNCREQAITLKTPAAAGPIRTRASVAVGYTDIAG